MYALSGKVLYVIASTDVQIMRSASKFNQYIYYFIMVIAKLVCGASNLEIERGKIVSVYCAKIWRWKMRYILF